MFEYYDTKRYIKKIKFHLKGIKTNLKYDEKYEKLEEIKKSFESLTIWNQPHNAQKLAKECSCLTIFINDISIVEKELEYIDELISLSYLEKDRNLLQEIIENIKKIEKNLKKIEFKHMFRNREDKVNCYIDIQAGSGGIEAQEWASILLRMYLRWAESHNFKIEVLEESIEYPGLKSATVKILGHYAYGWLRTETGIHRLVRKSPFDSGNRRHTSFSSVFVYPEVHNNIDIDINPSDIRIDVYRASGAGGQHVNRTESAVRITHFPTKLVTQCQKSRSQHKNKEQALKQMQAKIYQLELHRKNIQKQEVEKKKSDIAWGNQIRSYVLDDSRIKDLRTGIEDRNVQNVLNGNLDQFIEASLKLGL